MRKDKYLVGYSGSGNVLYGKYHTGVVKNTRPDREDYAQPMTEFQAKRALKKMSCSGAKIFKLVEIKSGGNHGK